MYKLLTFLITKYSTGKLQCDKIQLTKICQNTIAYNYKLSATDIVLEVDKIHTGVDRISGIF